MIRQRRMLRRLKKAKERGKINLKDAFKVVTQPAVGRLPVAEFARVPLRVVMEIADFTIGTVASSATGSFGGLALHLVPVTGNLFLLCENSAQALEMEAMSTLAHCP